MTATPTAAALDERLTRLAEARVALLDALRGLDQARFVRRPADPAAEGDRRWPIREVLWHVADSDRCWREWIEAALRGEAVTRFRGVRRPAHLNLLPQLIESLDEQRAATLALFAGLAGDANLTTQHPTPSHPRSIDPRGAGPPDRPRPRARGADRGARRAAAAGGALMGTRLRPEGTMPWMPGFRYGALLPPLALNLLVRDTERAAAFYRDVLDAEVHYRDIDFAAVRVGPAEVMLHADHTHDEHPWSAQLAEGATRGVGAQLRLLGIDPDAVEARAREHGAQLVAPATDKGHGWRETLVRDPDGYEWAVGVLIEPAKGPFGPHEVGAS